MEKNQVNIPIEAEFHMLRHFESFSQESLERIRSKYSSEQIDTEIEQAGSRFYRNFATDIPELLNHLSIFPYEEIVGENGNHILRFQTNQNIGEKGIAALNDISIEAQEAIVFKNNRGILLKHLQVEVLPSTNVFVIILKPEAGLLQFVTAFPGEAAMPLPFVTLEPVFRIKCQAYWNQHVFLDLNKKLNTFKYNA
jgi:hypothetical protein